MHPIIFALQIVNKEVESSPERKEAKLNCSTHWDISLTKFQSKDKK